MLCIRLQRSNIVERATAEDTLAIASPETDSVRRLEDLPSPRGLPLVRNFHQLLNFEELHRRIESWEAELGQSFTFRMFSKSVLVTSDPKLADIVLLERPEAFRRLSNIQIVADELDLNGLFSVEGAAWFRQRNLVLQALGPNQLPEFFPTLRTITERLRSRWERVAKIDGVTAITSAFPLAPDPLGGDLRSLDAARISGCAPIRRCYAAQSAGHATAPALQVPRSCN